MSAVVVDHIVRSYFIPGSLIRQLDLQVLKNEVDTMITQVLDDDENLLEGSLYFQQDGELLCYDKYLKEYFRYDKYFKEYLNQ